MATQLPTRQLGSTDLNITRVGFGAWATGGGGWAFGWGPQDDDQSIAARRRNLQHPIAKGRGAICAERSVEGGDEASNRRADRA